MKRHKIFGLQSYLLNILDVSIVYLPCLIVKRSINCKKISDTTFAHRRSVKIHLVVQSLDFFLCFAGSDVQRAKDICLLTCDNQSLLFKKQRFEEKQPLYFQTLQKQQVVGKYTITNNLCCLLDMLKTLLTYYLGFFVVLLVFCLFVFPFQHLAIVK